MSICTICQDISPTVSVKHKISFGTSNKGAKAFDVHLTVITNVPICNVCLNSLLVMHISPQGGMGRWLAVHDPSELSSEQFERVKSRGQGVLIEVEEEEDDQEAKTTDKGQDRSGGNVAEDSA